MMPPFSLSLTRHSCAGLGYPAGGDEADLVKTEDRRGGEGGKRGEGTSGRGEGAYRG